jgi:hypothetical protein
MNRRTLISGLLALPVVLGLGCLSPTLPLPPPAEPDTIHAATAADQWTIAGACTSGAMVLVRNERTGEIAGVEDREYSGRYSLDVTAQECDLATIFEAVGDDITEGTRFLVREVVAGVPQTDCGTP